MGEEEYDSAKCFFGDSGRGGNGARSNLARRFRARAKRRVSSMCKTHVQYPPPAPQTQKQTHGCGRHQHKCNTNVCVYTGTHITRKRTLDVALTWERVEAPHDRYKLAPVSRESADDDTLLTPGPLLARFCYPNLKKKGLK